MPASIASGMLLIQNGFPACSPSESNESRVAITRRHIFPGCVLPSPLAGGDAGVHWIVHAKSAAHEMFVNFREKRFSAPQKGANRNCCGVCHNVYSFCEEQEFWANGISANSNEAPFVSVSEKP